MVRHTASASVHALLKSRYLWQHQFPLQSTDETSVWCKNKSLWLGFVYVAMSTCALYNCIIVSKWTDTMTKYSGIESIELRPSFQRSTPFNKRATFVFISLGVRCCRLPAFSWWYNEEKSLNLGDLLLEPHCIIMEKKGLRDPVRRLNPAGITCVMLCMRTMTKTSLCS